MARDPGIPGSSALIIWLIDPALLPTTCTRWCRSRGIAKTAQRTLWADCSSHAGAGRGEPAAYQADVPAAGKRVIMDKDATNMSRDQVLEQVERRMAISESSNPDRANKTSVSDAFRWSRISNVAAQQFQVMQDSGEADPGHHEGLCRLLGAGLDRQSGVAISNLVEQGATTLSEINDNYRMGCQQMGQLALAYHLLEDMASKRNYKVTSESR